jgi:hypothetical protein
VVPFSAVTIMLILVVDPAVSEIAPDADPEATETPFTVTVDVESVTVGVTVIDDVALDSPETVYELVPERNEGLNVPEDTVRFDNVFIPERPVVVNSVPDLEFVSPVEDVNVNVGV